MEPDATGTQIPSSLPVETSTLLPVDDTTLPVGEPQRLSMGTHCGVRVLERLINGMVSRTDEANGSSGGVPAEWEPDPSRPDGPVELRIALSSGGDELVASLNGRDVTYRASGRDFEQGDYCS